MYKNRFFFMITVFLFLFIQPNKAYAADFIYPYDTDEKLVIVLDPGHGGTQPGAIYEDYEEKDLNLEIARGLKEELEKYEGVFVYLTHEKLKSDMSLKDRAAFAKEKNADILLCLHFNMSTAVTNYGSEDWISGFDEENRIGYAFAKIHLEELQKLGLHIRGIKTRINDEGTDYYGIIRESKQFSIPTVLIEHCHLDHENDHPFYNTEDARKKLIKADATAVAKFFGLKSEVLGVDYSKDAYSISIPAKGQFAPMDITEPDICIIEKAELYQKDQLLKLSVTACDYDSPIQYYAYSLDGGENYSPYYIWPQSDMLNETSKDSVILEIPYMEESENIKIRIKAINKYDLSKESDDCTTLSIIASTEEEIKDANEVLSDDIVVVEESTTVDNENTGFEVPKEENTETKTSIFSHFLKICLVLCILIFLIVCTLNIVILCNKGHKNKKK